MLYWVVFNTDLISFLPFVSLTGEQIYIVCVYVILPLIKEGTTKGKYVLWLTQAALLFLLLSLSIYYTTVGIKRKAKPTLCAGSRGPPLAALEICYCFPLLTFNYIIKLRVICLWEREVETQWCGHSASLSRRASATNCTKWAKTSTSLHGSLLFSFHSDSSGELFLLWVWFGKSRK